MKKPLLFAVAVVFTAACESTPTEIPGDLRWFEGAPYGEPTVLAGYDEPDDNRSGAAPLADGRFVFAEGASLQVWSETGTETLGPWDEWSPAGLGTPLVVDGVVVAFDNDTLAGIGADGELLWQGSTSGEPVEVGDLIGFCVASEDGCIFTLRDPHTGAEVWTDSRPIPPNGLVPLVGDANVEGFCLVGQDEVRVFGPTGVERVATSIGSTLENEMGPEGAHDCTPTPWGAVVSYSDFRARTHRVVGFDSNGAELWSRDLEAQSEGELAEVFGYLDGALVRTDSGVRRLDPDGAEIWGPDTRPMVGVYDVAPNGDMLIRALPSGNSLHAVHADGTPFMEVWVGPGPADIYVRYAALDEGRVFTTAARQGILDRDRWAEILVWE